MTAHVRADRGAHDSALSAVQRVGRTAWSLVGVLVLVVAAGWIAARLSLVVVPVILALFPATLLVPVARWLKRRGVPAALAAAVTIMGAIAVVIAILGGMVALVAAELPRLATSAGEGLRQIDTHLGRFGVQIGRAPDLLDVAREQITEAGDIGGRALSAASTAAESITGVVLMFVVLFFYLKDGRRLANGVISGMPRGLRSSAVTVGDVAWETLGAYFRGQLLVALVDAVAIGLGLLILGVPLALPLAVLIFFGGLFPIVGAVVSGTLAVLVALADGGLVTGLIVLAIVLGVQQLEGNVLEPLILGRAIRLHPIVVLLSIAVGAVLLGVLGAFLAVPVAAIAARTIEYVSAVDRRDTATSP